MRKAVSIITLILLSTLLFTGCGAGNESETPTAPENEISFAEFKALRVETPTEFHVLVKLSDYYNYEFRDGRENYYSFMIYETDGTLTNLAGFLPKDNPMAKRVFDTVKDGEDYPMTLKIGFIEGGYDKSDCVLITDILSIGQWSE